MQALAGEVVRALVDRGWALAVAESCTGGLIGHLLTDVPGSSRAFPGGVVAYANRPKREVLGVPGDLLVAHGAVSAEAVMAMAEGVRRLFGTEIGLAVSGIAGPTGGNAEKPLGTVYIACAAPSGATTEHHVWSDGPDPGDADGSPLREHNKHKTAMAALELVLRRVRGE